LRTNGNSVGILGMGINLPEKVLNNYDLEKMVDTSNEWITKRTGMWERRILSNDTPSYMMGVGAAKNAIENSGLTPEDIDLVIVTTEAPDYLSPSTSCLIQRQLHPSCYGLLFQDQDQNFPLLFLQLPLHTVYIYPFFLLLFYLYNQ
jgi:3-oxoacyl-[acyl-carrier-protein] synthase III